MELYQSGETKEEQKKEMESEIVMTNYHFSEFEKREEFVHADYEIVDRTSESADVTLQTSNADKLIAELETAERIVIELERLERKGFPAEQLEQFKPIVEDCVRKDYEAIPDYAFDPRMSEETIAQMKDAVQEYMKEITPDNYEKIVSLYDEFKSNLYAEQQKNELTERIDDKKAELVELVQTFADEDSFGKESVAELQQQIAEIADSIQVLQREVEILEGERHLGEKQTGEPLITFPESYHVPPMNLEEIQSIVITTEDKLSIHYDENEISQNLDTFYYEESSSAIKHETIQNVDEMSESYAEEYLTPEETTKKIAELLENGTTGDISVFKKDGTEISLHDLQESKTKETFERDD